VSFDHRDAGTAESAWADDPRWGGLEVVDLARVRRVLVVAAHPDDESLGAGGLIARLHDGGARVTVLLATAGEGSHGPGLAPTRSVELAAAIGVLAPGARVVELGLPDGGLGGGIDALAVAVSGEIADVDLVVAPWRGDGHGDHRAAGEVAAAGAARAGIPLLEYPIWLWHWAAPDDDAVPWGGFVRMPLTVDERRRKVRALAAYESQTSTVDGEPPILHRGMLAHFERDWEIFVRTTA